MPLQERRPTAFWDALGRVLTASQGRLFFLSPQHWQSTSGVLGLALGSPVQGRHRHTGPHPAMCREGDYGTGATVMLGEAE